MTHSIETTLAPRAHAFLCLLAVVALYMAATLHCPGAEEAIIAPSSPKSFVLVTNLVVVTNYVVTTNIVLNVDRVVAADTNSALPDLNWVPPADSFDWIQLNTEWLKGRIKAMQDRQLQFFSEKLSGLENRA